MTLVAGERSPDINVITDPADEPLIVGSDRAHKSAHRG
jgi:hypothetical protein